MFQLAAEATAQRKAAVEEFCKAQAPYYPAVHEVTTVSGKIDVATPSITAQVHTGQARLACRRTADGCFKQILPSLWSAYLRLTRAGSSLRRRRYDFGRLTVVASAPCGLAESHCDTLIVSALKLPLRNCLNIF